MSQSVLAPKTFKAVKKMYLCILKKEDVGTLLHELVEEKVEDSLEIAFESGHTEFADKLSHFIAEDKFVLGNKNDILEYYYNVMQSLYAEAPSHALFYADMLYNGRGGEKDISEALRWYRIAADRYDISAANSVAGYSDSYYSSAASYYYAMALKEESKDDSGDEWLSVVDQYLDRAITGGFAKALMAKHEFEKFKKKRALVQEEQSNELDSANIDGTTELLFPDLELFSDSEYFSEEESKQEDESSASLGDLSDIDEDLLDSELIALNKQWDLDRKIKKQKKQVGYFKQTIRVSKFHLDNCMSLSLSSIKKKGIVIPEKTNIDLLYAVFGLRNKKFHNYTSDDAMQLFEKMGCNVGVKGESFHIEYKDEEGVIHKFSSHLSHGRKENRLYRPTDAYLRRFCLTIGLTKEVIESY